VAIFRLQHVTNADPGSDWEGYPRVCKDVAKASQAVWALWAHT
jgi:hypothetical protein